MAEAGQQLENETIREADCETFCRKWMASQERNAELSRKNMSLEIKNLLLIAELRKLGKLPAQ